MSHALCTGTPTADFADLFSSASDAVAPTGTDTLTTDLYPSQTAISLYYTPTGKQGPGAITGSATAATKVESSTAAGTVTMTSQTTGSGTASTGSTSTSSSKAGAAPTQICLGALGAVALGMGVVAL